MQDSLDRRIKGKILFFKNKIEEIEAIEKYYERNFLFQLRTHTQQKKKEIQKKLLDILLLTISDGEKAKELHFRSILRLSTGLRRLERIKEEL